MTLDSTSKYYTGVGSRDIPEESYNLLQEVSKRLGSMGWVLRSGGAVGADTAFETGVGKSGKAEIYLPWARFNDRGVGTFHDGCEYINPVDLCHGDWLEAHKKVSEVHPAWNRLKNSVRTLHTRNVFQVMGRDLKTPSKFLICYAPIQGDSVKGGTATAYNLAKSLDIPCFNIYNEKDKQRLLNFIGE